MISWVFRPNHTAAICAIIFAMPNVQATTKADLNIQALANFPRLQTLAKAKPAVLRGYLNRVSATYRQAGYPAFASALKNASPLLELFGDEADTDAKLARRARATLRHLKSALKKNQRIALPEVVGQSLPNYYDVAFTFLKNADQALKNLAAGKNVANFLRKSPPASWITNLNGSEFSASLVTTGGTKFITTNFSASGGLTKLGAGTLTLNGGANSYTGATTVTAGTLNLIDTGSLSSFSSILGSGYLNIQGGGTLILSSGSWVLIPADYLLPTDTIFTQTTFGNAVTVSGVVYPAGTRLAPVPDGFVPSAPLVVLATPVTITTAFAPAPSPTP